MSRRIVNVVTAGLVLMGLGYVIAVSARDLPGQDEAEPLLDLTLPSLDWLVAASAWAVLAVAVGLAAFLLLNLRRIVPRERPRSMRWLVVVVAVGVGYFISVFTFEELESGSLALPDIGDVVVVGEATTGAAWVVGVLLAVVIAAAFVRVAILIRSGPSIFGPEDHPDEEQAVVSFSVPMAKAILTVTGSDPRSRVINAYAGFEAGARDKGAGRRRSETSRRHTTRVASELSIDSEDLTTLSHGYSVARFGESVVKASDAALAEAAYGRIKESFER